MKYVLIFALVTVLGLSSPAFASVNLKAAQDKTLVRLRSDARAWIPVYKATGPKAASWIVQSCTSESADIAACRFSMRFRRGDRVIVRCSGVSRINANLTYIRPLSIACVR